MVEMRGAVCCFVRRWLVVTCLQSKRHVRPFELSLQANEAEIPGPRDVVSRTPHHESRQEPNLRSYPQSHRYRSSAFTGGYEAQLKFIDHISLPDRDECRHPAPKAT